MCPNPSPPEPLIAVTIAPGEPGLAPTRRAFDLRDLPPPEPLVQTMRLAGTLRDGDELVVRTPCWPEPLFASLRQSGFVWDANGEPDGSATVIIRRRPDGRPCLD